MTAVKKGGTWSVALYHRGRYWFGSGPDFRTACKKAVELAEAITDE